jgi:hypothetical protein
MLFGSLEKEEQVLSCDPSSFPLAEENNQHSSYMEQ